MQGHGHDESAPTPCGVFVRCFVVCSQRYWQSVSSRRGIFIVPAYTKTPTKWRTKIRIRRFEYTYFKMWKCVFVEMDTRF